jgi:hypothetical protein
MKIRWNLDRERFTSFIQAVQERTAAAIQFISGPRFDFDPVGFGSINQVQRNLRLALENHVLGNVVFFDARDHRSIPRGKNNWASSKQ